MDTYRDDWQAAMARAEAAEKLLADQEKLIDMRVLRMFVRAAGALMLVSGGLVGIVYLAPMVVRALDEAPPPPTISIPFVCATGGNGGNLTLDGGDPGKGCGTFPDGAPGSVYIGSRTARTIEIGKEDTTVIIHGNVEFENGATFNHGFVVTGGSIAVPVGIN